RHFVTCRLRPLSPFELRISHFGNKLMEGIGTRLLPKQSKVVRAPALRLLVNDRSHSADHADRLNELQAEVFRPRRFGDTKCIQGPRSSCKGFPTLVKQHVDLRGPSPCHTSRP